tara:strand:- start:225 stop:518 length:294 start_codon:yes stop_codon:yes gene_type:complete
MAKIIKFPNTPMNELSSAQKLAMEMETEKNQVVLEIEWNMNRKDWDKIPNIDGRSLEVLALFGEAMKFNPQTASRLISKLAEAIKRNEIYDPLEEYQ